MRVYFKSEGGIAHFPGLSRPITVEVEELPAEEARELRRLVEKTRFFELPREASEPGHGAADYRHYEITVEEGARSRTVRFADPVEDPDLQKLITFLKSKTRSSNKRWRA